MQHNCSSHVCRLTPTLLACRYHSRLLLHSQPLELGSPAAGSCLAILLGSWLAILLGALALGRSCLLLSCALPLLGLAEDLHMPHKAM